MVKSEKIKSCSKCHTEFKCGINQGIQKCWCNSFPAILPVNMGQDCYCPTCLANVISKSVDDQIEAKGIDYMIEIASQFQDQEHLVELVDYTVENGNYVFNKWYHLKRGSCCGNNCRNCPYR